MGLWIGNCMGISMVRVILAESAPSSQPLHPM